MPTLRIKTPSETTAEIRKRIASAEHLIDVKARQLPKLREKLMWAMYEECTGPQQQKFMQIYNSLKDHGKLGQDKTKELTSLIERTIKVGREAIITVIKENPLLVHIPDVK